MTDPKERGQVLVLLAAFLFFGGSASSALVVYDRSPSEIKKAVKRTVTDSARRDAILTYIDQWEALRKQQDKGISSARATLLKTLRRKDATRSEADQITAKLDTTSLEMDQSFLNLRFRVKDQTTSAEWAAIVRRPEP
jgi:predicted ribosome quality control (RQC) complex YloA/Tae2 family protein